MTNLDDALHENNRGHTLEAAALQQLIAGSPTKRIRAPRTRDQPPPAATTPPIPAEIRAELDVTPAWWDRQFDELVKKHIPRDWAYHQDHDLEEPITFYAAGYEIQRHCLDCGVTIERPPSG